MGDGYVQSDLSTIRNQIACELEAAMTSFSILLNGHPELHNRFLLCVACILRKAQGEEEVPPHLRLTLEYFRRPHPRHFLRTWRVDVDPHRVQLRNRLQSWTQRT